MPSIADPYPALIGGGLIGLSAALLMALSGRVAGISGMVARLTDGASSRADHRQSAAFVAGLLLAPWLLALSTGRSPYAPATYGIATMTLAGLLVGAGARLANGCTSGHGVCGLARFSRRSAVAVACFMTTAALIVAARRAAGAMG